MCKPLLVAEVANIKNVPDSYKIVDLAKKYYLRETHIEDQLGANMCAKE